MGRYLNSKIRQGLRQVERRRVELPTSALRTSEHPDASEGNKELASTPPAACTAACTSEGKNVNADAPQGGSPAALPQAAEPLNAKPGSEGEGTASEAPDPLAALAAAIANLSAADRERLVAMLGGQQ